jgi:hypothetical protein
MNTEKTASETNFDTLMGAVEVTIKKRDGTTEKIKVLQLPVEKYPELASRLHDEGKQIELYCERQEPEGTWKPVPIGWAAALSPAAHNQVMETAGDLNKDFFEAWLRRRVATMEAMRPGVIEKFLAVEAQTLPSTSPKRRTPADFR